MTDDLPPVLRIAFAKARTTAGQWTPRPCPPPHEWQPARFTPHLAA